jgi:hypothetical protein
VKVNCMIFLISLNITICLLCNSYNFYGKKYFKTIILLYGDGLYIFIFNIFQKIDF